MNPPAKIDDASRRTGILPAGCRGFQPRVSGLSQPQLYNRSHCFVIREGERPRESPTNALPQPLALARCIVGTSRRDVPALVSAGGTNRARCANHAAGCAAQRGADGAAQDAVSPLPEGEGQGEGERDAANQNGRTNLTSSTRLAPRANGLCCQKEIPRHVLSRTGVSRQARWCFERCFPLTPALSLGERENRTPRFRQSRASRLLAAQAAVSPLRFSTGEGSGHRSVVYPADSLVRPSSARLARKQIC